MLNLGGGEWSASRPDHLTSREKSPHYPLDKRLGETQNHSGRREEKNLAPTGTRTPTLQESSP
jgi:hypothetical protein